MFLDTVTEYSVLLYKIPEVVFEPWYLLILTQNVQETGNGWNIGEYGELKGKLDSILAQVEVETPTCDKMADM